MLLTSVPTPFPCLVLSLHHEPRVSGVCVCVCRRTCVCVGVRACPRSWVLCYLGSSDGGASKRVGYSSGSLRYCWLIGWGVSQANRPQTLMWHRAARARQRERGRKTERCCTHVTVCSKHTPFCNHLHLFTDTYTHMWRHANGYDPLRLWRFINLLTTSLVSLCLATCFSFAPPCLFAVSLYAGNVEGNWPMPIKFLPSWWWKNKTNAVVLEWNNKQIWM